MTQEETLRFVLLVLGGVSVIGGFLYWHFKTVNSFKDEINNLKIHLKELENRDALQQQTIDQLDKLYPMLNTAIEKLSKESIGRRVK